MAKDQYCIVDNTIDPTISLDGLTGLTEQEANQWLSEHQVALDEPIVIADFTYTTKYSYHRDNWATEE